MKIGVHREHYHDGYGLYIFDENERTIAIPEPLKLKTMPKEDAEGIPMRPVCMFKRLEEFQQLFDDLWVLGMRPSARSDEYKAQLETMKHHLNDMRAIVFKTKNSEHRERPDLK